MKPAETTAETKQVSTPENEPKAEEKVVIPEKKEVEEAKAKPNMCKRFCKRWFIDALVEWL